jgi:hypothetical protein
MRFYYGGFPLDHNTDQENVGSIGLLIAERDRLAGLRPNTEEPGLILTRPFLPGGRRILVNARIIGELRAEVRTDDNKTVEGWSLDDCDPVTSSGFASEVTWQGKSLSSLAQDEIRILFRLTNAELFAFDLAP